MNTEERFRLMHNFAKNNPDHPDSVWFRKMYPDYDSETGQSQTEQFRAPEKKSIPAAIIDYGKRAGKEIVDQPGFGYDRGMNDLQMFLSNKPTPPLPGDRPPVTAPGKVARFAGEMMSGEPLFLGMGGMAQKGMELAGQGLVQVLGGTKPVKKTRKLAAKTRKKIADELYPKIAGQLATVPAEAVEHAIKQERKGKSIFTGEFRETDWNKISSNFVRGVKKVGEELAKPVKAGKQQLRKLDIKLKTDPFQEMIQKHIEENSTKDGFTNFLPREMDGLNDILATLSGVTRQKDGTFNAPQDGLVDIFNLQIAKDKIDNIIVHTTDPNQRYRSDTEGFLAFLRGKINQELSQYSPDLAVANRKMEKYLAAIQTIGKDKVRANRSIRPVQRNLLYSAERVGDVLNDKTGFSERTAMLYLNHSMPDEYKFAKQATDQGARQWLESWFPGIPSGSGSKAGAAQHTRQIMTEKALESAKQNPGRSMAVSAIYKMLVPLFIPKVHKAIIRNFYSPLPGPVKRIYQKNIDPVVRNYLEESARWNARRLPKAKIIDSGPERN